MSTIIEITDEMRKRAPKTGKSETGSAQILMFTGVRYERRTDDTRRTENNGKTQRKGKRA